ncbi:MAG: hypothetical protein ACRDQX_05600, partial [Pseudonocardiaceae bacterium]
MAGGPRGDVVRHPAVAGGRGALACGALRTRPAGGVRGQGCLRGARRYSGGLAELVADGGTGVTAGPGDPERLADALTRAAAVNRLMRMGAAGLELPERFDYRGTASTFCVHWPGHNIAAHEPSRDLA